MVYTGNLNTVIVNQSKHFDKCLIEQVVGYDGSTTIAEFVTQLSREAGFRSSDASGFAVYSDDPIDKEVDHALHPDDKVGLKTLIPCLYKDKHFSS